MSTVLFVCVGNTFRSVIAERIFNAHASEGWRAESAGILPGEAISPAAIELLREIGLDVHGRPPRAVTSEVVEQADLIVAFGCRDQIPNMAGRKVIDWPIPGGMGRTPQERTAIREEISQQVLNLIALLRET